MVTVKACILDVDYLIEEGEQIIRIWGKTQDGKSRFEKAKKEALDGLKTLSLDDSVILLTSPPAGFKNPMTPQEARKNIRALKAGSLQGNMARDLRRAAWETACGEIPGAEVGLVTIHPEGRERPGVWMPHVEVLVVGARRSGNGWKRLPLPRIDIARCRRRWGYWLVVLTGCGIEGELPVVRIERVRRRRAAAWYVLRAWPGWTSTVTRMQRFGSYRDKG